MICFLLIAVFQFGPDANPDRRTGCPTGEIRVETCIPLEQYFDGQIRYVQGSIQDAVDASSPGDVVVVPEGIYREEVQIEINDLTIMGEGTVSGAVPINNNWEVVSGSIYRRAYVDDAGEPLPALAGTCPWSVCNPHIWHRQFPVVGGELGTRKLAVEQLTSHGDYYVDGVYADDGTVMERPAWIYLYLSAPAHIEYAVREKLLRERGQNLNCANGSLSGLRIIGLTFQHAASRQAQSAVCTSHANSVVEGMECTQNGMKCIDVVGHSHVVRGIVARENGIDGIGGGPHRSVIEYSLSERNGWRNALAREVGQNLTGTGIGGGKLTKVYDTVIRRSIFRDNEGPGLWLDVDGAHVIVEQNLIDNNLGRGIFIESGVRGDPHGGMRFITARNNVVMRTRYDEEAGGGVAIGIDVYGSKYTRLLNNTVIANALTGIAVRRKAALIDPDPRGTHLYNNLLVGNNTRGAWAGAGGVQILIQNAPHWMDGNVYSGIGAIWRYGASGVNADGTEMEPWRLHWQSTGCDDCASHSEIIPGTTELLSDDLYPTAPVIDAAVAIPDSIGGTLVVDATGSTRIQADVGALEVEEFSVTLQTRWHR